jgi:hypothetical protein
MFCIHGHMQDFDIEIMFTKTTFLDTQLQTK